MSELPIRIVDEGDHLKLYVPLKGATLRLNRFDDDPYYVEAVEHDRGDFAITDDEGASPPLDMFSNSDLGAALDAAVEVWRARAEASG